VSAEAGKVGVYARSVKKPQARLKHAASPFCFGEYMMAQGKGGRLILVDYTEKSSFFGLANGIIRYYAGFTVLETTEKLFAEASNVPLLRAALTALTTLDYGGDEDGALLKFMLAALSSTGYSLNFDVCASCSAELNGDAFFDFGSGTVCGLCRPKEGLSLSAGALSALRGAQTASLAPEHPYNGEALELIFMIAARLTGIKMNSAREYLNLKRG
jgi:DNA repair protein RecO (recombination protein O)